ncbi:MAG: O-acetyltransferase OatA, partial [Pseudomonadota bacterium]
MSGGGGGGAGGGGIAATGPLLAYRPEVDGLRALAVLPVMLFHAGFSAFGGGFVGVDVFFVISGYLITGILLAELEQQGRISIAGFYERRFRRILPALCLVILVCLPPTWLWLLPKDVQDYSASLMAVAVFASNLVFWGQSGYFDTAAELKPLLHTWSLAVEEQYYLLFPLLLAWAWPRLGRRRLTWLLAGLLLVSLGVAQKSLAEAPAAAFFLLPARGWELLVGALVAVVQLRRAALASGAGLPPALAELGGLAGLALLVGAVLAFDQRTPFPGLAALLPTGGAALVILCASGQTWVGRLLGHRLLVGLGLISYSAYLWHQPLYALARHRSPTEPGAAVFTGLLLLSLGLAWLSWRFVERPFRRRGAYSRRQVFAAAAGSSALLLALGLVGLLGAGQWFGQARAAEAAALDARIQPNHGLSPVCDDDYSEAPECRSGAPGAAPEVLVWGDSYAMHLVPGLLASRPGLALVQKTVSTCGPLLGIAPIDAQHPRPWAEQCLRINDQVLDYLARTPSIRHVVLASPFSQYLAPGAEVLTRAGQVEPGAALALAAMRDTLARIQALGRQPLLVSPPPQNGQDIGRCLSKAARFQADPAVCDIDEDEAAQRQAAEIRFLTALEAGSGGAGAGDTGAARAPVLWLSQGLCAQGRCRASADGVFIYRDRGHLSIEGSAWLGRHMDFSGHL